MPFTKRVRQLVDTPQFQRLQHVSQLGVVTRVYPGANHTRFEHALGVYHNATRYLDQLSLDPRFTEAVDVHEAEVFLCTALLHDIGHWPFCHPIEDMKLPNLPPHEAHAAQFLADDGELTTVLRNDWGVEPAEVLDALNGKEGSRGRRLIRSLLSGPIDIDKMDYLDRDSLHAGVPYGRNFDRARLIGSLVVNEAGDGLAVTEKGKTAAELMVFARYVMFSEVYWHHAVRSATAMFARAFYELHEQLDLAEFFQLTERDTIETLRGQASGTPAEPLIEGVFGATRQLYKQVAEYSLFQSPELYGQIARRSYTDLLRLGEELVRELISAGVPDVRPTDIVIDAPPPGREVEFNVEIFFPKEQTYRKLASISPVTEALAQRQFDDYVKRVRIFVHPDHRANLQATGSLDILVQQAARRAFEI
ncbi:HD domain protein [Calycomorphotria hydatis]|uniref:HD domain protein n=1 Tax=Calycomorphotria hydatis TaxID=2528027 RepID=A0A517TF49_9PLAN|nr:HD domain protein [Calycomorphotria hydatis]